MKIVSPLALAAVLAGGLTLAPAAVAAKKEEKKAGPKYSQAVIKAAQPAQTALQANDAATAEPLVTQVEAAATTEDDKYIAAVLRYNVEQLKYNAAVTANPNAPASDAGLAKPLDALIASPSTPAEDRGKYLFRRAAMAYNAKQYPVAIDYFNKAQAAGYVNPEIGLYLVRAKVESGDVAGGMADLEKQVADTNAKGAKAPEEYYRYAIARSNRSKLKPQTMTWLNKYVAAYPSQKTWYEVLATYGIQQDSVVKLDNQQKIDLFRLMRATGGLADQYYYLEYAQKAQSAGLPFEAQAVLKEGIANGKIPATNTEAKAMQTEVAQSVRNEGSLAALETKAKASPSGSLAMQTADANLGAGNYAKAVELYRLAQSKGGVDADAVNLRLGIALAQSGDKAGAGTAFAAVKTAPRADIAQLWTTYINQAPAA